MLLNDKSQAKAAHGGASAGHRDGEAHHIMPMKTYFVVFGALLFLTVITVAVSYAAFPPPWAIIIAMLVAMVKAFLVAAYFMHLKWDDPYNRLIFGGSVFFIGLFFFFTFADLSWRGHLNTEERTIIPSALTVRQGNAQSQQHDTTPKDAPADQPAPAPAP